MASSKNSEFPVNTYRHDPYLNYNFVVQWKINGKMTTVAGINRVSGLTRSTQVVNHRTGGDMAGMRKVPGQTDFAPITLERGVTHDVSFEQWANKVWSLPNGLKYAYNNKSTEDVVSLADFRKDISIIMMNEAGQPVLQYHVYRCWVSEYIAMPELNAAGNAIAIQQIVLQNEGWVRNLKLSPPKQTSYEQPASNTDTSSYTV